MIILLFLPFYCAIAATTRTLTLFNLWLNAPAKTTMELSCLYNLWLNQLKLLPLQEKVRYGVFDAKTWAHIQP